MVGQRGLQLPRLLYGPRRPHSSIEVESKGDGVFVDFDDPRRLHGAWDTLYRHRRPSHYSPRFSESVSNFVYWLDPRDPHPKLVESDGRVTAIELSDPGGARLRIPVP